MSLMCVSLVYRRYESKVSCILYKPTLTILMKYLMYSKPFATSHVQVHTIYKW